MGPVEHYLSRVAPLAQGGYISVHLLGTHGGLPGKACSNFKQAIMLVNWFMEKNLDLFLSQGGQERHGPVKQGKTIPEADRTLPNIWCLKSLRMDIDRKLYSSAEKMDVAVEKFYTDTGFPRSPFAIRSGSGGYHLYWPFDRLVHPDEWQPMADALSAAAQSTGLKFDTECTVDRTRVLRIPGTKNYKVKDKPTNVEIWYDTGEVFTVAQLQQPLAQWVKPLTASSDNASEFEDERNMQGGGKTYAPVDIEVVRKECGFVDHTLNTGGTDASYYLWWLSLCLARHTTNPHAVAHALSNKHHSYSQSETTEKFKDAEKQSKGPPFCATIARHGATQCPACKHNNRNSNPISITYGRNGHTYHGTILSDLPQKYYRRATDNLIYCDFADEEGGRVFPHGVFPFQIIPNSGRLEDGSPYTLIFKTKEGDDEKEIRIGVGHLTNLSRAGEVLGDQGLPCSYGKLQKDFFMSFIAKLRDNVISIPEMGWHTNKDGEHGFSFNGTWVSSTKELPAKKFDSALKYGVAGDAKPWTDLVNIIVNDKRPDLCCLVAASFAAPLIHFVGLNGFLIGGVSNATGIGKTSALSTGQGVWGSITAMNGLSDTYAHVIYKAGKVKNGPLFYDEIKDQEQIINFGKIAAQITDGKEKARADRTGKARATSDWELPVIYAANKSMIDAVGAFSKGTNSPMVRMLEFHCNEKPLPTNNGLNVDVIRIALKDNYGHAGLKYARYLGEHRQHAYDLVHAIQTRFKNRLGYDDSERFWFGGIATIAAAAYFARSLGLVAFNVPLMTDYLAETINTLRIRRQQSSYDYSNRITLMGELNSYLRDNYNRIIFTDIMVSIKGRPKPNSVTVFNEHPMKWNNIWPCVQISKGHSLDTTAPMIRFTDKSLEDWAKRSGIEYSSLKNSFIKMLPADYNMVRLGAGTRFATGLGSQYCFTINVKAAGLAEVLEDLGPNEDSDETETDASS